MSTAKFTTDQRSSENTVVWLVFPSRSVKGLPPIEALLLADHRVDRERFARQVRVGKRTRIVMEQHVHVCKREADSIALMQIKAAEHQVYARNIRTLVATEYARAAQRIEIEALGAARKALKAGEGA